MFAFRRVVSVTRLCLRYRLPPSYFIFHASCPKVGQFSRRDAFRLFLHFLVRSVENLMKTVKYRKIRNNIFDAITKKRRTSGKKRTFASMLSMYITLRRISSRVSYPPPKRRPVARVRTAVAHRCNLRRMREESFTHRAH